MTDRSNESLTQRIVEVFLRGNLSVLLIVVSLLIGAAALILTPREEEPQIVVPLADVIIQVPGASAEEVERQVSTRLEKLLYQIDGVEHVYSMSQPGMAIVTVRFYVGEDRVNSLVKLYNKIDSNTDKVPPIVTGWVVKPVEIDDVPIVNLTLYSDTYSDYQLRRLAEEVEIKLQSVKNTNRTYLIGGRPRVIWVDVDPSRLAAHTTSPLQIERALQVANAQLSSGDFDSRNVQYRVEAGTFFEGVEGLRQLVIGVHDGRPVHLEDVADVFSEPQEVTTYTRIGFGPSATGVPPGLESAADEGKLFSAVNVAIAKKRGTNAVWVANDIEARMKEISEEMFADGVYYRVTRDYGKTADDKVNELVEELILAIIIVIGLILLIMGWREGLTVAVAVPITFSLTLMLNYLVGFSINRVTLFALVLSLGLVVDDPIVDVENIYRHFKMRKEPPLQATLSAVNEVRPPIILATLAVIISFVPMFFITGMMGPYMRPMAFNVPLAMLMSLFVAFTVTPWMAYHVLKGEYGKQEERPWVLEESPIYRLYNKVLPVFLHSRSRARFLLFITFVLFCWAGYLAMGRFVPLKMLPFDNKNEFEIVVDMPEGTTLQSTDAVANQLGQYLRTVPEVTDFQTYVGTASPMDFNGMVRHYYLREGANVAEVRVNLVAKKERAQQSHDIILRIRRQLDAIAWEWKANIKMVETPPGPPVIATVVAEVYGRPDSSYQDVMDAARVVRARLSKEGGVVDVDDYIEADQTKYVFVTDKEKASLNGVATQDVAQTLRTALAGADVSVLHVADEVNPLPIVVRVERGRRSSLADLRRIYVMGSTGNLVMLGEIGHFEQTIQDKTIYHKDLRRVSYVLAGMAGRPPAEAIIDIQADRIEEPYEGEIPTSATLRALDAKIESGFNEYQGRPVSERSYFRPGADVPWRLGPQYEVQWAGEGEWQITLSVFRDLGLAFAAACVGIYILLIYQTGSYFMPLILMISIPLTMIGIMPGFWILNAVTNVPVGSYPTPVYFTATAMIGMIALSGIAVRNAILLIEFVHVQLKNGHSLYDSLVHSGAVRFRPILLTAGAAMLAAWPITLDPIFSGLAWALIFGLTVSTAFTLLIIPVVYWMVYENRPGHGLPAAELDREVVVETSDDEKGS